MDRRSLIYDGETLVEETYLDTNWREVRAYRDMELEKSDWRASSDLTLSDKWRDFRQFLRDLPQSFEEANDAADAFTDYEKPEGWY